MWNAFFPRATVVGLDLEPLAVQCAPEFDVTVGSQSDPRVLAGILERHPDIRIVVDDASHITDLTLASFRFIFPRLDVPPRDVVNAADAHSRAIVWWKRSTSPLVRGRYGLVVRCRISRAARRRRRSRLLT